MSTQIDIDSLLTVEDLDLMQLYAKYGVKEYWPVDPEARTIEAYVLESGLFGLQAAYGEGDELTSDLLPDFRCKVEDIFRV